MRLSAILKITDNSIFTIMNEDYKKNERLFIYSMVCFTLFLSFSLLTLYITPHLIWSLNYKVPSIVTMFRVYFENDCELSRTTAKVIVWSFFAVLGIIFGLLSYYFTKKLGNDSIH